MFYDWAGGLIWVAMPFADEPDAGSIRSAVKSVGGHATLIVRQFTIDSSAAYVDVPWQTASDLEGPGCAAQVCAVDHPVLGRYVELEHHSPAIDGAGSTVVTDISHLWAIRGAEPDVRALARQLFDWPAALNAPGVPD